MDVSNNLVSEEINLKMNKTLKLNFRDSTVRDF